MTPPLPETVEDPRSALDAPAWVVLYNDDWHSFDDVIIQLVLATGCDAATAEAHAWTVHTQGKARVFDGPRTRCESVAQVLRQIRLQVEVDWDA